ncbi:hypothetical protein AAFF_G00263720 [Aldrovandia affinis]|uniref:Uncharacterized protein n=1 Tax=Aldrovandia affinis TaxID=143900 RepID=A0AAD7SSP3_9TELE|nr:hypothetical protein AAFF_G00263720 [Aldrovandia affinis]
MQAATCSILGPVCEYDWRTSTLDVLFYLTLLFQCYAEKGKKQNRLQFSPAPSNVRSTLTCPRGAVLPATQQQAHMAMCDYSSVQYVQCLAC